MSREQQELNRSGNINYICKSYSIMNDLIIKILAHEKTIIIYMNQQILRKKIQDFLYTCSTSPQFMRFVELNKEKINEYMRKNNLFQKRQHQNFSQKYMIKTNVNRYVGAFKLSQLMNQPDMIFRKCDYIFTLIGMSLNTRAFLSTIQLLGTQQQINKWQELVLNGKAFGSYGQTELGHGSNVQGMETQALYDQKKQTFILKSPKITSSKYWPGALGMVCTHTVLQARTFVKGQSIGLQTFIIQIRDQNLQTKKGVKSGDIGPKFGYHRVDNGYLILQNVQIPRESMLMKYVKVTPQGQVLGKENKEAIKYAYGSMLQLRVTLPFILSFNHIILPANQLYGIYQRLGINNSNEQKFQLINHLSIGIGIILSNMYSQKLYNSFLSQMKAKNYKKADKILAKCHIISATFKTLTSQNAVRISRDIAVGNNFSIFRTTGIPYSYNYIVSSVTYEGDNSVLFQQIARYILKQNNEQLIKPKESQINNSNMNDILNVFRYVSSMQVKRINGIIKKQLQGGIGMNTIWNERRQKEIIQVARFWGITQIIEGFIDTLNDVSDPELKNYFYKAGKIFIKSLMKDAPQIFLYGFNLQLDLAQLQFSNEQFWALTHIERPMFSLNEGHQLIERPGNWIKSKL